MGALISCLEPQAPLAVVDSVDVQRYSKRWYEVARLPFVFEPPDAHSVTATYQWVADASAPGGGYLRVLNEMYVGHQHFAVEGKAYVLPTSTTNTRFSVTFEPSPQMPFVNPFPGAYHIIMLDKLDYTYAVVSEPTRRHLWILSSTPVMDQALFDSICTALVNEHGFRLENLVGRLKMTPQTMHADLPMLGRASAATTTTTPQEPRQIQPQTATIYGSPPPVRVTLEPPLTRPGVRLPSQLAPATMRIYF